MRILFVDDEPKILDGLKRMLRGMRHEWEMDFANSGSEALDACNREPFDVIVADMKMPGMDGADLLTKVKQCCPNTIRLILSGHSSPEMVMKSVGAAHQYLAKPCDAETIKETISRTLALRTVLTDDHLKAVVSGIQNLPSMPAAYQEIVACLQDPNAGLSDVGRIVGHDIGMTGKILQLVNSAFFGLLTPVGSIEQAVSFIGLEALGSMVLAYGVFSKYERSGSDTLGIEALWRYSADTAAIAKSIAKGEGMAKREVEDSFTAGMLHEVGKLVLATEMPAQYNEATRLVDGNGSDLESVERKVLGATHAEVGAYLLGLWGLPDSIVEAVAYHERPAVCESRRFGIAGVVHVASRMARDPGIADPADPALNLDLEYLEKMGKLDHWTQWWGDCQEVLLAGSKSE